MKLDRKNKQVGLNYTKPFLKWAGGKRWLVKLNIISSDLRFKRYIEPFVGSGAIFFSLRPKDAILADSNQDLINTYIAIKTNHKQILHYLKLHHEKHNKEYYYSIRSKQFKNLYEEAAKFIYLNRTCWNGLYRVNKKGEFNVPIGNRSNILLDESHLDNIARLLKNAKIYKQDFEKTISFAKNGDLLFIDPPYTVKHNRNNFIRYNEKIFSWHDQKRLKDCLLKAKNRGVLIIMTNANHHHIRELYNDFNDPFKLSRKSLLAASASSRNIATEALYSANIQLSYDLTN